MDFIIRIPLFYWHYYFNSVVRKQLSNPKSIPIIIINYNQLFYLKKNIDILIKCDFQNIFIIDNCSTYPELLEYYDQINRDVTVISLKKNYGHKVLFKNKKLFKRLCGGFYFLSDADIVLNVNLPNNFRDIYLKTLISNHFFITKVGSALDISDIPDCYPLKRKVLLWEEKFWVRKLSNGMFKGEIDTTFALYKPCYFPNRFTDFSSAIRIAGDFTSKHGGWYICKGDLIKERTFYLNNNISTSWIYTDEEVIESNERNSSY
jgi:hypothetical protein